MKLVSERTIILVAVIIFIPWTSPAQIYKDMSIGLAPGMYIYQGDLTPLAAGSFKTPSWGINLFAKKPLNYFLSARLNISLAKLRGDDSKYNSPAWRKQRNFMFSTSLKEFSAQIVWNILGRNYDDRGIMPYLFTGAGVFFVNIKKDYSRLDTAYFGENSNLTNGLAIDNTVRLPRRLFSIPIGVGAEYSLSDRFSLNLETAYRFIFTDYLDGFSRSANPNKQDHYHSTSVGLVYKFGSKNSNGVGCPVLKY